MEDKKICPLCDMNYEHSHFTYDIIRFTNAQEEKYEFLENKYIGILEKHAALIKEHVELQEKFIKVLSENALLEVKLKQD
jgi:hypothetical protein